MTCSDHGKKRLHWPLALLDRHSYDGLGAMATAFRASAETLLLAEKVAVAQQGLPKYLLLRHVSELPLKSTLVVRVLNDVKDAIARGRSRTL